MTKQSQEVVYCSQCGQDQTVPCYESINVTLDPQLKTALLNGDLNNYRCARCNNPLHVVFDTLYHDMHKRLMFWLCHEQRPPEDVPIPAEGYMLRHVVDTNELIEKVLIVDAGLDDRIMEVLKLFALVTLEKRGQRSDGRFLFNSISGQGADRKLELAVIEAEREGMLDVPLSLYTKLQAELGQAIAEADALQGHWPQVGPQYGMWLVDRLEE